MNSITRSSQPVQPWYKQGWPWFLIMFPAVAVVAGTITLVIAVRTFDGLVVDDYQKAGKAIVQNVERAERARALGLEASVHLEAAGVRIALDALDHSQLPARLLLTISHPTRADLDQSVSLVAGTAGVTGVYEAPIAPLGKGRWLFLIEDEHRSWKMNGATHLPTETDFRIVPPDS